MASTTSAPSPSSTATAETPPLGNREIQQLWSEYGERLIEA
ncbi:hypothetical protein ACVOMV_33335 [Mesorhizobium atlanticum]